MKNFSRDNTQQTSLPDKWIERVKEIRKAQNFKEVYSYLKKQKISLMTNSSLDIEKIVYEKINKRVSISKINKINDLGDKVLKKNLSELDNYIK